MKKIIPIILFSLLFQHEARTQTVTDIDGNIYNTVVIGTQTWMQSNLTTTRYQNGSAIGEVEDSATWATLYNTSATTPAWCIYEDNASNNTTYGKLYNYYAVVDPRNLCPTGWHVPSDSEWEVLGNYLGGDYIAGGHMKSVTLWTSPNTGADNSSGFAGLPGGYRASDGQFNAISYGGYWWGSTAVGTSVAWFRFLYYGNGNLPTSIYVTQNPLSVRCLSDSVSTGINQVSIPSFSVYPNPCNNFLTVSVSSPLCVLSIYNVLGQQVFHTIEKKKTERINTSFLPNGIYFLQQQTENNIYSTTFLIQH